jgi:conjugative transfer pilus assembly protein TraH
MKKTIITLLIIALCLPVQANDYIDKWIDQKTVTGPDHFSTQKRGYGTFGSFSARFQSQNEYPISITKPRFEVGCGGIDLFMGGFSFLKFDYLVDKLTKMMGPAAAAFAFQIALGSLNAQAKTVVTEFSSIIDQLNSMQFSECSAAKSVTVATKQFQDGADLSSIGSKFMSDSGLNDHWDNISKSGKQIGTALGSLGAQGVHLIDNTGQKGLVDACSGDLKDIMFTPGSLISNVGTKNGLSKDQIDLLRGLVGDVLISIDDPDVSYSPLSACSANSSSTLDCLVGGEVQAKILNSSGDWVCQPVQHISVNGQNYPNLRSWVIETLVEIGTGMAADDKGLTLTPQQLDFLKMVPLPIMTAMRIGIVNAGPGASNKARAIFDTASTYSDYIASLIAYRMIGDLYTGLNESLNTLEALKRNEKGAANPANQTYCNKDLAADGFAAVEIEKVILLRVMNDMHKEFEAKINVINASLLINETIMAKNAILTNKVKSLFGSAIASKTN